MPKGKYIRTPEIKLRCSIAQKNKIKVPNSGQFTSIRMKAFWSNPKEALRTLQNNLEKRNPTSHEKRFILFCELHDLPLKFVGNGAFWRTSNGKHINPDFLDLFDEHFVVEVYYPYLKPKDYEEQRRKLWNDVGYVVAFLKTKDLFCHDWQKVCLDKLKPYIQKVDKIKLISTQILEDLCYAS